MTDTTETTGTTDTSRRAFAVSLGARSNIADWCGIRGGGTAKHVRCYVCDGSEIVGSSFAAKYRQTKTSHAAVAQHWVVCHEVDFQAWRTSAKA